MNFKPVCGLLKNVSRPIQMFMSTEIREETELHITCKWSKYFVNYRYFSQYIQDLFSYLFQISYFRKVVCGLDEIFKYV